MLKDMATNKCLINKIKYLFFSRTLSMVNPFLRGLLKLFFLNGKYAGFVLSKTFT